MKCAAIILFCACTVWAAPTEENSVQLLAVANRQFAAGVYKEILKTQQGNLIFSPFSAETVLALLSAGANGPTHDELVHGLSLPSSQQSIQKSFKEFLPKLTSNTEDLKLLSANKIYAGKHVKLEKAFEQVAVDVYHSGVENIDFSKNVEAANTINKWVETQTHDKIKDLIKSDSVSDATALVLVNALYLSAKWVNPFEDFLTKPQKFYKNNNDHVEVPTMSQIDYFHYYDNTELGVKFLELPYVADGLSMVIALPHEKEGLTALEKNVEKLLEPQPLKRERVDVKLPQFTIDSEIPFVDILKALGVNKIFGGGADLSGLSSTNKNLLVSDVIQKAFINVTETGTEAAAATAVQIAFMSSLQEYPAPPPPKPFYVEHPFSYCIKKDDVILFAGRVDFQ
ncbi:unnamed protein product [Psylliodes chrysocephalus]|uniref:Serpin domain-containing protein n=1 Tax=Psylliodes chrysocephalus TaxID=3402493 RepID=A0A9P0GA78_9CUCU|nr:unnamed protein product [Psylliodes chrysocephala]